MIGQQEKTMARKINRLNPKSAATIKECGRHADGNGLYLSISPNGGRRWVFLYRWHGKPTEIGLGSAPRAGTPDAPARAGVKLADARELAAEARALLAKGINPKDARSAPAGSTFGDCAKDYIEANRAGWKNDKHLDQWRMTLLGIGPKGKPAEHDYCKSIRGLAVDAVTDVHVMKILQPIWNTKTETANRIRGRIEKVLDRAKALKLRSGENPARWVGHLDQLLPKKSQVAPVKNYPALPYQQMPELMAELRQREGIAARALEFTILTAARTSETIGARATEIEPKEKLWTIPKERMKGKKGARKRDHVVPLTREAIAILDDLPKDADFLFPGGNLGEPLSNAAMAAVIDRMNEDRVKAGLSKWVDPQQGNREIVPHGFRSTFKDWCSEATSYPNDMSEMALSHTLSDKVEAAYRRGDMREKRRQMMAAWATFCSTPKASKVVQLARKA
ncbi:MAG: tyrosine-type recombinase/integrase [Pseudomonadota bacterium]